MLDPNLLKENIDLLELSLTKRNLKIDLSKLEELNEERKSIRFEAEQKRAEQKEIGKLIASASVDEKAKMLEKASSLSEEVKSLFDKVEEKDRIFFEEWIKLPNLISDSSPVGKTDEDNLEIKKVGSIKK